MSGEKYSGSEEGESENDEYVDVSPDGRWHRRDTQAQTMVKGVNACYLAIDMEEGKEVVWNEIIISKEMHSSLRQNKSKAAVERVLKNFKGIEHNNLLSYGGYWIRDEEEEEEFKIIFITEYTSAGTLRGFLRKNRNSKKSIGTKLWKRWCRQILDALDYLHRSTPSITHGHLNCDTIYIHHDGIIKVGSVAPNIIKDFLHSLSEGHEFDEKWFYKTPNSTDLRDFGNCLLEVFATGVEDFDLKNLPAINLDSVTKEDQQKGTAAKKGRREMTEEEQQAVLASCDPLKQDFLNLCFSPDATAAQLREHCIFREAPPLKVLAFYSLKASGISTAEELDEMYKAFQTDHNFSYKSILVNDKPRKIERQTQHVDFDKLITDIDTGMFPLCGIDVTKGPRKETPVAASEEEEVPSMSKKEERLILTINCHLNPSMSAVDTNKANLLLEFQFSDNMVRKLDTEISLHEDSPTTLVEDLVKHNLLNESDRQMVIESLDEVLYS